MADTQPIYELPAAIATYTAKPLKEAPADAKECRICYRTYGQKDDEDDEEEDAACEPMQLACGHVFGSEYLDAMIDRGFTTCSYCATRMEMTSGFAYRALCWLADAYAMRRCIDTGRKIGRKLIHVSDRFAVLAALHRPEDELRLWVYDAKLFAQDLTGYEALQMWLQYCKLGLFDKIVFLAMFILPAHLTWKALDTLYKPYVELRFLPSLSIEFASFGGFVASDWATVTAANIGLFCIVNIYARRRRSPTSFEVLVFWFLGARTLIVLLGVTGGSFLKVALVYEAAVFVTFCVFLAVLISHGVKGDMAE